MVGGMNIKLLKDNLNFMQKMEVMKWVHQTTPILSRLTYKIQKEVEWDPKGTQNVLKSLSVYMTISVRPTLRSLTAFKNCSVYVAISLWQLSKPQEDSIAHAQMIACNLCNLNWCKVDAAVLVVFSITAATHIRALVMNFNNSAKLYFTARFSVKMTEMKFAPKWLSCRLKSCERWSWSYLTLKWNFTPTWNLKPVWVPVASHVNVVLVAKWKHEHHKPSTVNILI